MTKGFEKKGRPGKVLLTSKQQKIIVAKFTEMKELFQFLSGTVFSPKPLIRSFWDVFSRG